MTSTPSCSDSSASRRVSSITAPSCAGSRLSGNRKLLKRTRGLPAVAPPSRRRAAALSTRPGRPSTRGLAGGGGGDIWQGAAVLDRCHGGCVPPIKEAIMNRLRLLQAMLGLCLVGAAGAAWADDSPFAGRWRWNRPQSTVQPGEPLPKDIMTEIASVDPTRIRWSVTIIDPTDQKHVQTFDAPPDGQPHPVQGSGD